MIDALPIFPCTLAKVPMVARGFKSARRSAIAQGWPLIGFATGAASGIDVLDVDPRGRDWYSANFDALPQTRAHQTLHLLFKHAEGLRCSTDRVAPGIDVRADGGYAIWWPREGLPVEDWPICEWPDWLLHEAMGPRRGVAVATGTKRSLDTSLAFPAHDDDGRWTDALFELDPCHWRNSEATARGYEGWLALMTACKAVGISVEDFVEWSTQDPVYAGDGDVIARKWDSVEAKHGGVLRAALKRAGIKVRGKHKYDASPLVYAIVVLAQIQTQRSRKVMGLRGPTPTFHAGHFVQPGTAARETGPQEQRHHDSATQQTTSYTPQDRGGR
jgi:hypothetical protein